MSADGAGAPHVLVVQHEDECPVDRLGGWLEEQGLRLTVVRPYAGDPLPGPGEHDALIVLGGHMGAHDDDVAPWLPATRELLAAAVSDGTPVLGVCLGAQLLAVACGGRVEVGAAGIEAGVVDVAWRPEAAGDPVVDALLTDASGAAGDIATSGTAGPAGHPPGPVVHTAGPSMHLDAVTVLPPGSTWLASTPLYPHQAFRVGPCAWGVQFHPEVSLGTFRGWADGHDGDWQRWGRDGDAVVQQLADRRREVAAAGAGLARGFAGVVRSRVPVT